MKNLTLLSFLVFLASCEKQELPIITSDHSGHFVEKIPANVYIETLTNNVEEVLISSDKQNHDSYVVDVMTIGFALDASLGDEPLELKSSAGIDFHFKEHK